jgi:hypothetical protein
MFFFMLTLFFAGTALYADTGIPLGSGTEEMDTALPAAYKLNQNYPNSFNLTTTITYAIPAELQAEIAVYDVLGQKVAELMNAKQNAGNCC